MDYLKRGKEVLSFLYLQKTWHPSPVISSLDLSGQTALITGANGSLGLETAKQLAGQNIARLILGVRDLTKGEDARQEVSKVSPDSQIEVWKVDNEDFDTLVSCGKKASSLARLDIVILNAGVNIMDFRHTQNGHEMNMQINHLGTALLSLLLLPIQKETSRRLLKPSRMTILSSVVHSWAEFTERNAPNVLARMDEESSMEYGHERYHVTKLLTLLWAQKLAELVDSKDIIINAVNPGFCHGGLHRYEHGLIYHWLLNTFAWSEIQGAYCIVHAAAAAESEKSHGKYLSEQMVKPSSPFTFSDEGVKVKNKLWEETLAILNNDVPGIKLGLAEKPAGDGVDPMLS